MKKKLIATVLTSLFIVISLVTLAGTKEPGDPGGEPGTGDDPLGGGAPIGSGLVILLGLGAAYGSYKLHKKEDGETEDTESP